jgi:hypothetical protein
LAATFRHMSGSGYLSKPNQDATVFAAVCETLLWELHTFFLSGT